MAGLVPFHFESDLVLHVLRELGKLPLLVMEQSLHDRPVQVAVLSVQHHVRDFTRGTEVAVTRHVLHDLGDDDDLGLVGVALEYFEGGLYAPFEGGGEYDVDSFAPGDLSGGSALVLPMLCQSGVDELSGPFLLPVEVGLFLL